MTILDKIIADKRKDVEKKKKTLPVESFKTKFGYNRTCFSLSKNLKDASNSGIIAEFKRKSPSKSVINILATPQDTVVGYAEQNIAAISVLTNAKYFGGSLRDLITARGVCEVPLLRKEFMVDTYQIHESKAAGADVILLLANVLTKEEIIEFTDVAHELELEVLLEIRDEEELESVYEKVDVVGVNNRNLKTFEVNIEHSMNMLKRLPKTMPVIAESGLSDVNNVVKLKNAGFDGFLIGEYFMRSTHPGEKVADFIKQIEQA